MNKDEYDELEEKFQNELDKYIKFENKLSMDAMYHIIYSECLAFFKNVYEDSSDYENKVVDATFNSIDMIKNGVDSKRKLIKEKEKWEDMLKNTKEISQNDYKKHSIIMDDLERKMKFGIPKKLNEMIYLVCVRTDEE